MKIEKIEIDVYSNCSTCVYRNYDDGVGLEDDLVMYCVETKQQVSDGHSCDKWRFDREILDDNNWFIANNKVKVEDEHPVCDKNINLAKSMGDYKMKFGVKLKLKRWRWKNANNNSKWARV